MNGRLPHQPTEKPTEFRFTPPQERLEATGERYVSDWAGDIQAEHYHRYLVALRYCEGRDVLDVASGEGYGSALLGQVARSVVGVDLDEPSVGFANRNYASAHVSFREGDATALPLPDRSVDVVVSFETIEHFADHAAFMAEIVRVLRPGGTLVMSSPDRQVYSEDSGHVNPFHVKELSRAEFLALLRAHFAHVAMLEQRALTGSVILHAVETGPAAGPFEVMASEDGTTFTRRDVLPKAPFVIAVCSDAALPVVVNSVMQTPMMLQPLRAAKAFEAPLQDMLAAQRQMTDELRAARETQDAELEALRRTLAAQRDAAEDQRAALREAQDLNAAVLASTSWRVTAPLRLIARAARTPVTSVNVILGIARKARTLIARDGFQFTVRRSIRLVTQRGLRGAAALVLNASAPSAALAWQKTALPAPSPARAGDGVHDNETWLTDTFRIVPYYLDPYLQQDPAVPPLRVAVHLHLYYDDMTEQCVSYLRNIPARFDLFVSVPEGRDMAAVAQRLAAALPDLGEVHVEAVPNRGRDIAPLIVQFGSRLLGYDVVAHVHTKKSLHKSKLASWFDEVMATLCGSRSGVAQILDLLARDAKMVYPAGNKTPIADTGWSDNLTLATRICETHGLGSLAGFPLVEFPQGSMFWARSSSLSRLLSLPLGFDDFPEEPIAPDGTLAHALERLILVLGLAEPGRNYRLEAPGLSRAMGPFFEAQHDFSTGIVHDTVKVLAYYLPQFHPTPENSAWHGEGFTEWYKVRGAYPLFQGHYQQHVPHLDVGYYHIDSSAQLHRQAAMMRKAGVHGMIFYHYWFSGRMILEKPAQMLLADKGLQMPFCFCWANENWTRRWDGNEQEILLDQVYSPEDATAFIRYLIPFFRDDRYIQVEGRPVLMVYRPSSLPLEHDYVGIWRHECEAAGLPAPYLVAVLTRGTTTPLDHGMDAGAERVLHDWLGAAARDIRGELRPYWPINGSVLDYRDVAGHYIQTVPARDFPLFRSLVPVWDNTARYGSEAFLVHNFTTEAMQRWIEHLIQDAERRLPADRRFVIVNAWNEWAEGAHLEPDMRFGYGYLNAIGRALSDRDFGALDYIGIPEGLGIALALEPAAAKRLRDDAEARRKFVSCLAGSAVFAQCRLLVEDEALAQDLRAEGLACETGGGADAAFTLRFLDLFLFPGESVERLLQMGLRYPHHGICASPLNDPAFVHDAGAPAGQLAVPYHRRTGMELEPADPVVGYKVCPEAPCFRMGKRHEGAAGDRVSTVIRYHERGNRRLLVNALLSLLAQAGCRVRPCIGVQDLPEPAASDLLRALEALPWAEDCRPLVCFFHSTPERPDLRSVMLNEMLRAAGPDYVGFLDYDDILFPDAYATLLARLRMTGMNATFGRVYSTTVDETRGLITRRDQIYDYGRSYENFIARNHAPVHSFLLDTRKLDLSKIEYFDDMKYMEDYYLSLQIFSPNQTDWQSLNLNKFIGDYNHFVGSSSNTLAVSDPEKRRDLLSSPEYRLSEVRIAELKQRIAAKHLARLT